MRLRTEKRKEREKVLSMKEGKKESEVGEKRKVLRM